jgi:trimethylamine--corrinoid protein Co-methyltransferase
MLGGATLIYGGGMLENGLSMDLGQLIVDADHIRMAKFALAGMDVNDETLAVDLIKEIGIGGNFLSTPHTFENFRKLQSVPLISNRQTWDEWKLAGAKDIHEAAEDRAKEILAKGDPGILTAETMAHFDKMITDAEAEFAEEDKKNK